MSQAAFTRKIGSGLSHIAERKQRAAETIRRSDLPLSSGLWLVGPSFSVRAGTKLVPPLDGVKRWFDFRPGPFMRLLVTMAGSMIPPWFAWRARSGSADATVLLVSRAGVAVAFDLNRNVVVRHMAAAMAAELGGAVDRLRHSHTCPKMEYDGEHQLLIEEFVAGEAFRAASDERQLACVATIFDQLANAPRIDLPDDVRQGWRDALEYLFARLEQPPPSIAEHVTTFVQSAAACTVHGDLNGENIILRDTGHVVIDFDRVSVGPAFFDPLHLFMVEFGWGRTHLLDELMRGQFDAEIRSLGVELPGPPSEGRAALCYAAIGWKYSCGILTEARALELMRRMQSAAGGIRAEGDLSTGPKAARHEPVKSDGPSS